LLEIDIATRNNTIGIPNLKSILIDLTVRCDGQLISKVLEVPSRLTEI